MCVKKDTYTCVYVCVCEERCVGAWVRGCVGAWVRVCACMCVRERERERGTERKRKDLC